MEKKIDKKWEQAKTKGLPYTRDHHLAMGVIIVRRRLNNRFPPPGF